MSEQPPEGPQLGPWDPQQPQGPYQQGAYQQNDASAQAGQPAYGRGASHQSRKPAFIAAGLAAVLVVAGGSAYAYGQLSGGGSQPTESLPGNALAYFRMDIDPSAGQKISAVRFMDKLPKDKVDLTKGDLRENLFKLGQDESSELKDIDYNKDIKPWLGDRVGVSLSAPAPGGSDLVVAMAIQVKDEDKARQGIAKLQAAAAASSKDSPAPSSSTVAQSGTSEYFFHGDYAVFTQAGQLDAVKKAINDSPLSKNPTFAKDMGDLGEQGIISAWADMGQVATQFEKSIKSNGLDSSTGGFGRLGSMMDDLKKSGRTAMALRFNKDYVELGGITRGQSQVKKFTQQAGSQLGILPDDTAVAISVNGADEIVGNAWERLIKLSADGDGQSAQQQLDTIKAQYGISLPDDLKTLVGRNLVLAAPDQDVTKISRPDQLKVGASITTDVNKANDILDKLQKLAEDNGSPLPLSHKSEGDQFYLASNDDYLDQLSQKGNLGSSEAFALAVPDADKAEYAVYVDLDKVEHRYLDQITDSRARDVVQSLRSVGISAHVTEDGEGAFSMRLVSN